jgi:hypothetical protein
LFLANGKALGGRLAVDPALDGKEPIDDSSASLASGEMSGAVPFFRCLSCCLISTSLKNSRRAWTQQLARVMGLLPSLPRTGH